MTAYKEKLNDNANSKLDTENHGPGDNEVECKYIW